MTLEEVEYINSVAKKFKHYKQLPVMIRKLFKENEHEKIANIAIELSDILKSNCEKELSQFPSL